MTNNCPYFYDKFTKEHGHCKLMNGIWCYRKGDEFKKCSGYKEQKESLRELEEQLVKHNQDLCNAMDLGLGKRVSDIKSSIRYIRHQILIMKERLQKKPKLWRIA